ncbi:MAG TPA: LysM peptidoglycan-binding domain-containing protein [Solirubrobacteraceae bacterium]|jgi:soluble lytic murein transglycosylase-like protein|nr:LysM peptidoglycan-binding domain-containing protein [Solirubrobacteraceae bacterium]
MRALRISILAAVVALLAAPAANADVLHTVATGESLWSIAAQSNLTTRTVAAYNGLSETANVVAGSTIKIPSVAEGRAALARAGVAPAAPTTSVVPATEATDAAARVTPVATAPGAPPPLGAYIVRAGDTLSGLAAQTGVPTAQMAYMNGLAPNALLLIGTVLKLPTGAPAPMRAAEPAPSARVVPAANPAPTPVRLSADEIKALAAQHGAPPSLTAAIAWQESGFNNALVSPANARGVMQVMPGTWDWVNHNLAGAPLDPLSAADNVSAGSLYLAQLLRETNGDERLATAGYYQGLASVLSRGMFDDTQRYVDNVLALQARFGG